MSDTTVPLPSGITGNETISPRTGFAVGNATSHEINNSSHLPAAISDAVQDPLLAAMVESSLYLDPVVWFRFTQDDGTIFQMLFFQMKRRDSGKDNQRKGKRGTYNSTCATIKNCASLQQRYEACFRRMQRIELKWLRTNPMLSMKLEIK